jgi:hypothetical protein
MLATAVFLSVAPAAEDQRPIVVQFAPAAPAAAAPVPKELVCSWAVDPVTGRAVSRWGPGERP